MLADSLSLAVGSSSAADAAAVDALNSDDDAGDDAPAPEQSDAPLLPKATVKALVRDLLPEAMRASEQASDAVNVCLSEFLQVLTWKANEALEQEGTKKVLTDDHIGAALKELGLERYVEASKLPLERKAPKAKAKAPAAARVTAQGRAPMPPPEASEGGGSHEFKFGDEVEVAGAEAGYEGSWYLAEVVDAKDSAAVLVQYEALYQDDGSTPLTERIKASRLRPTPPPPAADWLGALAGGAACELRHEDGWWEVEYVSATSGGAHLVYSKAWQRKVSAQHANLRPGWKWTARSGKWGTRAKLGGPKAAGKKA